MPRNFVFCQNWISNSNVNYIFLVGDIIYKILLMLRESLLALSQLSTRTSSLFTMARNIVNITVGCKKCCIISKINKTHLIWGSIHIIDIQKKKHCAKHQALWNTQCNAWHSGTVVFKWDILFPVTQIRLKPVLHDTSDAIIQELTHQYVMINCDEWFWEI